jgi:FkbM family methyltransferase
MTSQHGEEDIIRDYFKGFKGRLLSLGENDGKTLSNVYEALVEGWTGVLVEPSQTAFGRMKELWKDRKDIEMFNVAISTSSGVATFYESGNHLGMGDTSLLSTLDKDELDRWKGYEFTETTVPTWTIEELLKHTKKGFDLISIDCEGLDYEILKQLDLTGCQMLIIEYNGKDEEKYIKQSGMKLLTKNAANLILV